MYLPSPLACDLFIFIQSLLPFLPQATDSEALADGDSFRRCKDQRQDHNGIQREGSDTVL